MALARAAYRPCDAERGVLHTVVRAHLETFLREAAHGVLAPHARWRPRVVVSQDAEAIALGIANAPEASEGMAARQEAMKGGGRLAICGMTKDVRMVFELTRLNKFFEIYDDEAAARARFA